MAVQLDHQLAIEHETIRRQLLQKGEHLGKEPTKRLAGLGPDVDVVTLA